jgi:hypothetical protein
MTGSDKAYSAPRLETLSLRETQDIDIHLGLLGLGTVDVHLGLGGLLS